MVKWVEEVEKAFKTNSVYKKKEKKKIIVISILGFILFAIAFIVDIYNINDDASQLILLAGLVAIMASFFMQLSSTSNKPVNVGIYFETFYYINKLIDKLRTYNKERISVEKEKIKNEIIDILKNLEEKSNTYSSRVKKELYSEFPESISKTIKKFIYKIDFAITKDIKIPDELLDKLEKFCTEHVNARNKGISEYSDINDNIISVFDGTKLGESEKISGSETKIELILTKLNPSVKFTISTVVLLLFIWLFVHFLVPLVYSIGDDTKLIVIFAAWGTFTYILYNSYFKKRL